MNILVDCYQFYGKSGKSIQGHKKLLKAFKAPSFFIKTKFSQYHPASNHFFPLKPFRHSKQSRESPTRRKTILQNKKKIKLAIGAARSLSHAFFSVTRTSWRVTVKFRFSPRMPSGGDLLTLLEFIA